MAKVNYAKVLQRLKGKPNDKFIVVIGSPLTGGSLIMPGLPSVPSLASVDVDSETGKIKGLF
jgi:formyltetrahydrofolate synthetase